MTIARPVLTQQELETPRTAAEMLTWVDTTHGRFNTKQLKAESRAGKHFADELIHEARPLALFAHRHFGASPQVVIKHVIGNQNYDGVVEDRRCHPESIRFLEVATTLKNLRGLTADGVAQQARPRRRIRTGYFRGSPPQSSVDHSGGDGAGALGHPRRSP
jgi:hypothetical protein